MDMHEEYRIEDLPADEIAELLADDGTDLSEAQAAGLKLFIEQLGGLENALAAIEMLCEMEKAA